MKKKFSKILGVGLTLALLCSLLLTAAPVAALSQPSVTVSPTTISAVDAEYNIRFELDEQLNGDITSVTASDGAYVLADSGDSFVITAAAATDVATLTLTNGTVTGTMSGAGTFTGGTTATFAAIGETCTITVLAGDTTTGKCDGSWATTTGSPTAVVGVGSTAADTITIVFDTDTGVVVDPTVTLKAGPGWINGVWVNATIGTLASVVGTVDTSTVVITLPATTKIGEGAEVRLSFTAGITNPDAAGDYNLTVETSKEDAVTSADYEIEVPDIGVLPGVVQQFNAVDVLMAQDTGDDAINTMVDTAAADYTIVVGPGEYTLTSTIDLDLAGLTLESSAGADETIIVADASLNADVILITVADVTVDGFTIEDTEGAYTAIKVTTGGDDVTVINNIMADTTETGYPEGISIEGSAAGATVSGNELDIYHTMMVQETASGCTLSGNTFGAGINLHNTVSDIDITGNTLIGVELWGIVLWTDGTYTDILIEGNTISETTEDPAIGIYIKGNAVIDDLQILGNDITDNEGVGILIEDGVTIVAGSAIAIKFNTITGNDADNDGYGIQNDGDTAVVADVDATLNWWGTAVADDVAAMVNDTDLGVTTYEPFLADTADAVFSASDIAVGATSLDAKDTVGVRVSEATAATVIAVAKYVANPQAAISDAIAFFDVYVAGSTVDVTIKFYAGDANSKLYVWSADTEAWADLSEDDSFGFSVYGGYIYIDYDADLLGGTPFAVVAGAVAEPGTPELVAPVTGADDVSLTPIFAWKAAADADGYYFEFADNANFVTPMVKLDGDLGRLVVTAYAYVGELPYSIAYYWRVKAVSGTIAAGNLAESAWSTGVFITMAEPEEDLPPVVIEETEPPIIIIEPIVEVVTPAATEITPAWIYIIIGVGGVLVIALLVLIVRTRRVA